jgi:hypothetical protein
MYKLTKENTSVIKDGIMGIPFDPANTDYQAYLDWLAEGNEPEPADEAGELVIADADTPE